MVPGKAGTGILLPCPLGQTSGTGSVPLAPPKPRLKKGKNNIRELGMLWDTALPSWPPPPLDFLGYFYINSRESSREARGEKPAVCSQRGWKIIPAFQSSPGKGRGQGVPAQRGILGKLRFVCLGLLTNPCVWQKRLEVAAWDVFSL